MSDSKLTGSQQTLFAGDTHASHSVQPGSDRARQMTATSGQKCIDLLEKSGRDGLLPRMLLGTSAWGSTLCYLTWKPKTTPGGRLLFQLAPSMPNTDEIESGLWPTPHSNCSTGPGAQGRQGGMNIQTAVALLPTPDANCYKSGTRGNGTGGGEQLSNERVAPGEGGQLSPTWVEWLQGYPLGWTEVD